MKKYILVISLFLFFQKNYGQEIQLSFNSCNCDSIISNLQPKMLAGINEWEKRDKNTHIVEAFKNIDAKNDSTISILSIPIVKINIAVDSLKKEKNFFLSCEKPNKFYVIPKPFTNKIYSYYLEEIPNNTSLLGEYSTNFILASLDINKEYKPLCFAYFLDKDKSLRNFLILKNNKDELIIVDRKLKSFGSMKDFIYYYYGNSIENLRWFIKYKEDGKKMRALYYITDYHMATDQSPIISFDDYDWEHLNSSSPEFKNVPNLWKYELFYELKLNPNVKLLNLEQFYDKYKMKQNDKKLKICVDNKFIDKDKLLIDPKEVSKIEIITRSYYIDRVETSFKEKILNIVTKEKLDRIQSSK